MTKSVFAVHCVDFGTAKSNPRKNKKYNPTGKVTKITIHHMAGRMKAIDCAEMHRDKRAASANWYIGYDGDVCAGIPEDRRAWTSSSAENDYQAVTIEVSNNTTTSPWTISEASYKTLIKLCVDICKRNEISQLIFTGNKNGNLTMHKYFTNTACPGDYLSKEFETIANEVNSYLGVTTETQNAQYPLMSFRAEVVSILKVGTCVEAFHKAPTISTLTNKHNALVTPLERYFASLGLYGGDIEANHNKQPVFGKGMKEAVKQYQRQIYKNEKYCDGVITAKGNTWRKLLLG